jgi:hypothetical protein
MSVLSIYSDEELLEELERRDLKTDIEDFKDHDLIDELEYRGYEIEKELSDFDDDEIAEEFENRDLNEILFATQLEKDTHEYLLQVMKKYSLQQIESLLPI